jgi:membrane protein implicated in regulation of membrane protease activity
MSWPDIYLLCFAVGSLWSIASLLLGGLHLGHSGSAHAGHTHLGHGHIGTHGHLGHGHPVAHPHAGDHGQAARSLADDVSWIGSLINPSCAAVFLAWFGGIGYLLTRHSGLGFWIDLGIAVAVGLTGAWFLAAFLHFLQSREQPLNPTDYEMVGVLGQVSCRIRPGGVGEIIYVRDGARRMAPARSEDGREIGRGEEVVVTRYEKGTAYVRTWEAMTQTGRANSGSESLQKETKHVE